MEKIIVLVSVISLWISCCEPRPIEDNWKSVNIVKRDFNDSNLVFELIFINEIGYYSQNFGFSFISQTMASQPCDSYIYHPIDTISKIQIHTLLNFNTYIKKDSDITHLFYTLTPDGKPTDISYIAEKMKLRRFKESGGYNQKLIYLKQKPDRDSLKICITILLTSNKKLIDTTEVLILNQTK